jgi:anti-sigma factor RsiW
MPPMHATDEALELYALKLLNDDDAASLEEHLLICELCRSSLIEVDREIAVLRKTLSEFELEQHKQRKQSGIVDTKLFVRQIRSN